jgi:hypothetical protein
MSKIKKTNYILFSFILSLILISVISITKNNETFSRDLEKQSANVVDSKPYIPLAPIDGFDAESYSKDSAGEMINVFFQWGIAIAVTLSVLMIIVGGFQYMTSDSFSVKLNSKERIQGAIVGLLLALSTYLILNEIDPNIINLEGNSIVNPN